MTSKLEALSSRSNSPDLHIPPTKSQITECATKSLQTPQTSTHSLQHTAVRSGNTLDSQTVALAYLKHLEASVDQDQCPVEQVANFLLNQIQSLQTAHAHLKSQELQNILPQGITHLLMVNFAKILYPGSWHDAGKKLLLTLLKQYHLERYLQEEHVTQISVLLKHDLRYSLSQVSSIHPSMEGLVYATLNLKHDIPITPTLVCQALLCTLLSCVRQKKREPNCYVIAAIPYLTGNHPTQFLEHLYQLLHQGAVSIQGRPIQLASLLPMLCLEHGWHQLPAVSASDFFSSPVIQEILEANNLTLDSSMGCDKSPLALLKKLAQDQGKPELYQQLCLHLQGMKENLFMRLLILATELWFVNTQCSCVKKILKLIEQKLDFCTACLPVRVAHQLTATVLKSMIVLNPSEAYLASCMPDTSHLNEDDAQLYQQVQEDALVLCQYQNQQLHPILHFSELIAYLDSAMTQAFTTHQNSYPFLQLTPPLLLASYLHTVKIAQQFTAHMPDFNQTQIQALSRICAQLDSCILPNHGGSILSVLNHITAGIHQEIFLGDPKTPEQLIMALNHTISRHSVSHHTYLPFGFNHHSFFLCLTSTHPLTLSTQQLKDMLAKLKIAGINLLNKTISDQDINTFVAICYPNKHDASLILDRLDVMDISTLLDFLKALRAVVRLQDRNTITKKFNDYFSKSPISKIPFDAILKEIAPTCDPLKIRSQFEKEAQEELQHTYPICRLLHRILLSYGCHVATADILEALYQVGLPPCLDIANWNHMEYHEGHCHENPNHQHLLLQFNLATQQLEFVHGTSQDTSSLQSTLESPRLIIPKGPSFEHHVLASVRSCC